MSNRENVIDRILAFDVTDTEVIVNPSHFHRDGSCESDMIATEPEPVQFYEPAPGEW